MEQLQKLRQWLQTFPLWGQTRLYIDSLPVTPDNAGLYPKGWEILEKKTDLLGNVTARCCQRFELYRVAAPGEDPALWLLQLQSWVTEQVALGLAPRLGDDPAAQEIRAEKGSLKERTAAGTAVYTVILTAEFVKKFAG